MTPPDRAQMAREVDPGWVRADAVTLRVERALLAHDVVVLDVSLLRGAVSVVIVVLGAVAAVFLLARRGRRWWLRTVPAIVLGSLLVVVLVAVLVNRVWQPFPGGIPLAVLVWLGVVSAAAVLAVAQARRAGWGHRVLAALAALLVLITAANGVNRLYWQYPTLRTALGLPFANQVGFASLDTRVPNLVIAAPGRPLEKQWTPPPGMPAGGVISQVHIPAPVSGFPARPGWVYLPPAYLATPRAQLPVLVLVAGQPGTPRDWLNGGRLAERMDRFAVAHEGLAPVVVIADDLGSQLANPLCFDSRLGNVQTYLTVDVPTWIRSSLQVGPDPRSWAIGGFSHGGTCALQMAVNAPEVYPTFVDISGQDEPTLGSRPQTVRAAFGGDEAAFRRVNPLDVLARQRFPDTAGVLVAGADDGAYLPQQRRVLATARAAGMQVQVIVLPGGHTWQVWGPGLEAALPFFGTRLGLTA